MTNTFSSIPLDQAHEQNNKLIKGDGRIIGIPENPGVLLRWMAAGPELARMVKEFYEILFPILLKMHLPFRPLNLP